MILNVDILLKNKLTLLLKTIYYFNSSFLNLSSIQISYNQKIVIINADVLH